MKNSIVQRFQISSVAAEGVASASARYARSLNAAVSIAVVDTGGHLIAFQRTEGASFHSRGVAEDKAATAVSFGAPTRAMAKFLEGESDQVRRTLQLRPQLVLLAGGMPIIVEGQVVGAIGVSGSTEEVDERIATEGLSAIFGASH